AHAEKRIASGPEHLSPDSPYAEDTRRLAANRHGKVRPVLLEHALQTFPPQPKLRSTLFLQSAGRQRLNRSSHSLRLLLPEVRKICEQITRGMPRYTMPSFIRPASLIMFWFQGGSQTSRTSASSTPSIDKILLCASCAIAGPIPQPGAVSVIFTSTRVPPSSFLINRQSYTKPRSTMFTGISGSKHCLSC